AVVDGLLARCGEDALVGLHREGAQSGASQTAAVHAVLASCRGWGGTALRPQRSVGADQVNADGAGSVPGTAPARAGGSSSGVEQLREQVDTVGDDTIPALDQQIPHGAGLVDGPHVHLAA